MVLFWKYLKQYKGLLVLALVLATINQVFSLLDPQIFRLIVDNYASKVGQISQSAFISGVLLLLLASIGVALVSRIAKNFQDYYVNVITQKVGTGMYANAVNHTFSLPYNIFEDQRSGEILLKMQKAKIDTQMAITSLINTVFLSFVGLVFVMVYAFTVHWSIGLVYLISVPTIGTITYFLSKKIKNAQKNIVIESAELAGSTTETIRNVELVKSLGLEDQEINRLNEVNTKILNLELKKVRLIRTLSFIQGTIINSARALLLLLMLWLIFNGTITVGQLFSLFIYSFFIFSPLSDLGIVVAQYQEAKASNEKLEEIINIPPQIKPENAVNIDRVKNIEFKNVRFSYNENFDASVENININIKSGETLAFVGPSGSGKTTLIKLILGLYHPTKGHILINGIDSQKVDYDSFRRKIGLVSQDTQLFAGTIRENLLFVNPKASDDECLRVLKQASVTNIIERGGKGLDTKIGEGGIKISGGEKQRLAIARALLRNPEILIFDEATSNLDSLTEKEITNTIEEIIKNNPNMIIVLVAHRLSTIAHADKIIVLEKGEISEIGSHKGLIKKKGLYAALWRQQSAGD